MGIVKETGSNVENFKPNDIVGVGTLVNSCRQCECCDQGIEVYCSQSVHTFNSVDVDGSITRGGYSSYIVVHERLVGFNSVCS